MLASLFLQERGAICSKQKCQLSIRAVAAMSTTQTWRSPMKWVGNGDEEGRGQWPDWTCHNMIEKYLVIKIFIPAGERHMNLDRA